MAYDEAGNRSRLEALRRRGVDAWGPERVYVEEDVDLDAIEAGAVIRHATLSGPATRVARGAILGTSGHAEIKDCQIGENVELGSGLYQGATFLEGAKVRGFAEIRPGTLLEEQAEVAHTVALKNTFLGSCCVGGSLLNFCDLYMNGGTSRRDHSEIGSAAVHFNFDPRGDKWGSLFGGIRGVLMRSKPVFVGGHCSLVGPLSIGFGSVLAAASVIRRDVGGNMLVSSPPPKVSRAVSDPRIYSRLVPRFTVTAKLIGTLHATDAWYEQVRLPHATDRERAFYEAARRQIRAHIQERIKRLDRIVGRLPESLRLLKQAGRPDDNPSVRDHRRISARWDLVKATLDSGPRAASPPAPFVETYAEFRRDGCGHLEALAGTDVGVEATDLWLQGIVEGVTSRVATQLVA